jgi:hypothetical protein
MCMVCTADPTGFRSQTEDIHISKVEKLVPKTASCSLLQGSPLGLADLGGTSMTGAPDAAAYMSKLPFWQCLPAPTDHFL